MKIENDKTTITKRKISLNGKDIIELLNDPPLDGVIVPVNASVTFEVPGGGNWSGTDLDIDDDYPVVVEWTEQIDE